MKIGIASDHAGYELKEFLKNHLQSKGYYLTDFGPSSDESCDYPDFAHPLATSVENKENDLGIIMCGSGNGINMTANKHQGVRSALAWLPEIASLARMHNNANVLALPARYLSFEEALAIVDAYLDAEFEGGRHERRVDKIAL